MTASDLDSLEDMLAALETSPSQGGRSAGGSRPTSTKQAPGARASVNNPPPDDDIDAFLDEIDGGVPPAKPAAAPANRGGGGGGGGGANRPVNSQPQNANRAPSGSNAGGGGGGGRPIPAGSGNAELQSQGYEMQNNKGKWFSPPKTNKATDFRINGTTSTRIGFVHAITLRSLDDYGNAAKIESPKDFVGINLTHTGTGNNVQPWIRDNGDCTYNCAFFADQAGTVRMEIKLCGNPMFDINIQVEDLGDSIWVAKPALPARPKELFVINIVTADGSRPEGVAPFEVQTMGDAEQLRLINNGDGTYKFQCIPQTAGHLTVQVSLHGQPIRDSPVTVKVGDGKNAMKVKQESGPVEVISDTRTKNTQQIFDADPVADYEDPPPSDAGLGLGDTYDDYGTSTTGGGGQQDVSNDDLAALLDELGG